jgi:hypothetical protein
MQLKENQSKNDKDEQSNGGSVSTDEHWLGPRYYQGHDVLASYVHGWRICVAKVIEIKKIIKVNMKSVLIKYYLGQKPLDVARWLNLEWFRVDKFVRNLRVQNPKYIFM